MASTIRNTTVSFGMTEFPVSLAKAAERRDVKFDYAVDDDGTYVKRQQVYVAAGSVEADDKMPTKRVTAVLATDDNTSRGVWVGDEFREIDPTTIDAVMMAGIIEGIEIEEFIPLKDVEFWRTEAAYFLEPQKGMIGAKPLRLLRDALKATKSAGVFKFCVKGGAGARQKLGIAYEHDGRVMVNVLGFADAMRDSEAAVKVLDGVQVAQPLKAAACQLVKAMMANEGPNLLETARDDAVAEREALYTDAIDGKPVKAKESKPAKAKADLSLEKMLAASLAAIEREKVSA